MALVAKILPANAGDVGSTPGSARSPGKGDSNPLQYSYLDNPMDRGAWQATVHGVVRVGHNLSRVRHNLNHYHYGFSSGHVWM